MSICGPDRRRGECCEDGLLIKLGGEQTMRPLRAILAFFFLGWSFMGVAIVADIFMGAIEKVTSKKYRKWDPKRERYITMSVWNSTVANLTLMALGSSAPEIMLNVIGIIKDDFYVEPLGPATIVGSAAFNLLIIIAVCISAIPDGGVRKIKEVPVYICTAIFSVFAYLWLLVILNFISPKEVEVWEGVLTFLFFPILVATSYVLDRWGQGDEGTSKPTALCADITKEELADLEARIRKEHGVNLTDEQVASFMQVECGEESSRAKYRIAATRSMFGGKKVTAGAGQVSSGFGSFLPRLGNKDVRVVPLNAKDTEDTNCTEHSNDITIEFATSRYAVLESARSIVLKVIRAGDLNVKVTVDYKTFDGLAKAGEDYNHVQGNLVFDAGVKEQTIKVDIVNDAAYEEDEEFYVKLSNACVEGASKLTVGLGSQACVVIIDDDLPGIISFAEETFKIAENLEDQGIQIKVCRKSGSTNIVSCSYRTEPNTALEGRDFEKAEGCISFDDGQVEAIIPVKIKGKGRFERTQDFRLILDGEVTGGAKFDPNTDGGATSCICTVMIESKQVDNLMNILKTKWDKSKVGHSNWRDQFTEALTVGGGDDDDEDAAPPGCLAYIMHCIALPWKLIFAFCPPVDYCDGWVCFVSSLICIGGVTVLIGDLAELLGCTLGIEDLITAITLVALGTSLPDTFASMTAALQDEYADASIVNVTGSNSVNVFLGIGLPWMIGSIHWKIKYEVNMPVATGDMLSFSILVFTMCAFCCIALLAWRRQTIGGELGGPSFTKYASSGFLCCLWLLYVILSALKASGTAF